MSTKKKIIIFSVGLIAVVLLLYLVAFGFGSGSGQTGDTSGQALDSILDELADRPGAGLDSQSLGDGLVEDPLREPRKQQLVPVSSTELALSDLENQVRRFVERWASFSNQTDFSVQRSLQNEMSIAMQRFVTQYIADILQAHPYQQGYYGISTKVVTIEIDSFSSTASSLVARVGARRVETSGDLERQFNQTAEVELVQRGQEWLIDGVFWQEP